MNVVENVTYTDLYTRWEHGHWRATEVDFSQDIIDWHERMDETQRRAALWNYTLFYHGENLVTETLGPFIDAAPDPVQKYFLATQLADEARHSVFFARFMDQVAGAGGAVSGSLRKTSPGLTWGFRQLFGRLDRMAEELRRDPSLPRLAAGITLYHILIEASLGQPGQHFIESYLERTGLLPGFLDGMRRVSADEQRHIGFGVKLLSDLVARDAACKDAAAGMIREGLPLLSAVFVPPGWDPSYTEVFDFTLVDIYEYAARSFEQKLRAAGLSAKDLNGALPYSLQTPPRDRAKHLIKLLQANIIGEKLGPPSRDPEAVAFMFDTMRHSVDHRHAPPRRTAFQWNFVDLEPWHLVVDNGSTSAGPGPVAAPDLVFSCRYEDFVDIFAGREDGRMAMLKRRMRPRGNIRTLLRMQKMFGGA